MNEIKEIFDALSSRVKSPIFGYLALFSLIINWKEFLYLLFSDGKLKDRIEHFSSNTDVMSLLAHPILLAIFYAIVSPWIKYLFIWLAKIPTLKMLILQARVDSNIIKEKLNLEEERNRLLEKERQNLETQQENLEKRSSVEDRLDELERAEQDRAQDRLKEKLSKRR